MILCKDCFYYDVNFKCTSASRQNPKRFGILGIFMKKDICGWLCLPYDHSGKCKFFKKK